MQNEIQSSANWIFWYFAREEEKEKFKLKIGAKCFQWENDLCMVKRVQIYADSEMLKVCLNNDTKKRKRGQSKTNGLNKKVMNGNSLLS